MIQLLQLERITEGLTPVSSPEYVSGKGLSLHPEGLFSESIFGSKDTSERRKTYSYVDLHCKVLHPALNTIIRKIEKKILLAINREATFNLDDHGFFISDPEGELNGISSIIKNFDKINLRAGSQSREDLIKMIKSYYKKDMIFISKIIIVPPYFREIELDEKTGGYNVNPLNEYYVKILRLSNQIESVDEGELFEVLSIKMNKLVLDLYEFISNQISQKQGLIRSNLLGKRADFTGRAVITGASSEVKIDEIGVPFKMLVKLFEPFIIYDIINSGNVDKIKLSDAMHEYNQMALSVPSIRSLLTGISKGDELTENLDNMIKASVQRAIKDKVVLAKRDPALHAESIQAFYPVMVDGNTIRLSVLKAKDFNADFDGDSCFSDIRIVYGSNKKEWCGNISELEKLDLKLFKQRNKYTKSNGIVVTKFDPQIDVFIDSINLESGIIEEKQITEFSKHENLIMYKVSDPKKRFKDFWVSEDHSLILYDKESGTLRKESPKKVRKGKDYLVQKRGDKVSYIIVDEVNILHDASKTVAYDFTVKDNFTFCTDDGVFIQDTMALYVPVTKEAIEEAKQKMIVSHSKDSMHQLVEGFSKDMVIGLYVLTRESPTKKATIKIRDEKELDTLDPTTPLIYNTKKTTVGRVLFNKILPSRFPFVNEPINKKKINELALKIYEKYSKDVYVEFCHESVKIGMKYFTIVAPSFSLNDFKIPPVLIKLKDQLSKTKDPEEANKIINQMEKDLKEYLIKSGSSLGLMAEAGGLKGYSQVRQILVAKGLIQDSSGNAMTPISNSYGDGLQSREFFDSGVGARSGMIDRVINTSTTGYLSRQLVYALQRIEADPAIKDCRTKRQFKIKVESDIAKRLDGRNIVTDDGKVIPFDKSKHFGKVVQLRSPIYCLSERVCATCYGELLFRNKSHYVGVMAAQVLGEPLSQTIMRTFHVGGSVTLKTFDLIAIITRLMTEKEKSKFVKIFKQTDSALISGMDGTLIIDRDFFKEPKKDVVIVPNETINMAYGYFKMVFENKELDITIDNPTVINLKNKELIEDGNKITIKFKKGDEVFHCPPKTEAFSKQVKIIESLLSGRQPWKSADHFCLKLYDIYRDLSGCDLIHIEILASNLLRDKNNPSWPARLNKNYNATVGNLKSIPGLESWLSSLSFENFNESITKGLVYDRPEKETILEQIVTGNL